MYLQSEWGGWSEFQFHYKSSSDFGGRLYRNGDGNLGIPHKIGADNLGLFLIPAFPYHYLHQPIFIPWKEITTQDYKTLIASKIKINFEKIPDGNYLISQGLAKSLEKESNGSFKI